MRVLYHPLALRSATTLELHAPLGLWEDPDPRGCPALSTTIQETGISPAAVSDLSRPAARLRPFDVQLAGGVVLHHGGLAEIATGEGKTLVACAPAALNALAGKGAHVTTVNDYLARRDAEWMGAIYSAMGLTVGCLQQQMGE